MKSYDYNFISKLSLLYATLLMICNPLYANSDTLKKIIFEEKPGFTSKFEDENSLSHSLDNFNGQLTLVNLWATWCEPCKEEMPSLQNLQNNKNFENLKILPINIGQEDKESIKKFFFDVQINAFEILYDSDVKLAKKFSLRGIPTSVLINKDGYEFAKIIGSIDFEDPKFVNWLLNYD